MLKVQLSGDININTIHHFVSQFIDNSRQPLNSEYEVDITNISFIAPAGVTALTNVISYLLANSCKVSVRYPEPNRFFKVVNYLDDCGFFELFLNQRIGPSSRCRDTTIQLKSLAYSEYDNWLGYTVIPWLSDCIKLDIKRKWPSFTTVLGEIFNNVKDHAGERAQIASTLMQHFPKKNSVQMAISDFGVGIPTRVRSVAHDIINDADAIIQAVQDNFSSKSIPTNRGAGLDTVISNAVHLNKGTVVIMSGYGSVRFTVGRTTKYTQAVNYPGTLLHLSLRTDTINHNDYDQEDFSWQLF